ncbi:MULTISPECIES: alpha/beta hydrolase [unclassified Nocardioides]|uniref:alpha/beta hydrolase n=1 Tax=unclassified Nocardioides TaxID=2615069 RepID=UPI001E40ACC4|nr:MULTISPECIES: alpha/beta hydrolase [unclassified Nocardioides]
MTALDDALGGEVAGLLAVLEEGFPPVHLMSGPEARAAVAARAVPVSNLDDVRAAEDHHVATDAGPLRVRVYHPHGTGEDRPAVLFLHGGGFVFCSVESHDGFCRSLSRALEAVVVSVDYRLAPEHPAPAAADDAVAALSWTQDNAAALGVDPARVVVAGDSAGGNLAAVTALRARDRRPALAGQVLLYPVVEPDFESESYQRYATGHFNTRAAMEWYWTQYLGGQPATTPLPEPPEHVVPSRAPSLSGLAPAVVVTAGRDPLASEGRRYAGLLRDAGVPVRHRHYPDLFHGFATIGPFPAAAAARELLWHDVRRLLGPAHAEVGGPTKENHDQLIR